MTGFVERQPVNQHQSLKTMRESASSHADDNEDEDDTFRAFTTQQVKDFTLTATLWHQYHPLPLLPMGKLGTEK